MVLGRFAGEGQCYGSPKNRLYGANHLAIAVHQSWAMLHETAVHAGCAWRRLLPLVAAEVISSQAPVPAHPFKPFTGLRIMN
jgi:hypothetical protein